ncbi:MAG: hypothetical protein KZQ74_11265, partial [gamma proteobacterium symbiont of Bathyaustriella thionipta]|nr:hypothetical protein [gamma proteobacterium symbiont of Bathyaustriella thionipta]
MNYKTKLAIIFTLLVQSVYFNGVDWLVESAHANPYFSLSREEIKEKMMLNIIPLGSLAMCMKKFSLNKDVYKEIALDYNKRNNQKLKELNVALEKIGELSASEIAIFNRDGYKAAEGFLEQEGFT